MSVLPRRPRARCVWGSTSRDGLSFVADASARPVRPEVAQPAVQRVAQLEDALRQSREEAAQAAAQTAQQVAALQAENATLLESTKVGR